MNLTTNVCGCDKHPQITDSVLALPNLYYADQEKVSITVLNHQTWYDQCDHWWPETFFFVVNHVFCCLIPA